MSLRVTLDFADLASDDLRAIAGELQRPAALHGAMAAGSEKWLKETGRDIAAGEHDSANRLGAAPTGHLAKAYEQIESQSSAAGASLLVPRASRLRAAFGPYVALPGPGKKYLTIPVAREAYGRRAGEFDDLTFMRVGPRKTPLLAKKAGDSFETMYLLVEQANIPEDKALIPFDELAEAAGIEAERYLVEVIARGNGNGGLA